MAAAGLALLGQVVVARMALAADDTRAYVFGRPVGLVCGFHARFGVPCPESCGITRGVAFAVHGDLARAWHFYPAAALGVVGLVVLASSLFALAALEVALDRPMARRTARRWLLRASLAYAGVATVVWLATWTVRVLAAIRPGVVLGPYGRARRRPHTRERDSRSARRASGHPRSKWKSGSSSATVTCVAYCACSGFSTRFRSLFSTYEGIRRPSDVLARRHAFAARLRVEPHRHASRRGDRGRRRGADAASSARGPPYRASRMSRWRAW